jgi:hypothetical protein
MKELKRIAHLALLGVGAGAALLGPRADAADRTVRRVEEFSVAREGATALRLQNPGGNLRFLPSSDDRIHVVAEKRVQGADTREAEAFLDRMSLSRRREGERWLFEASWPKPERNRQGSPHVNWEVRLPRTMRLDAETGGGNVAVEEVEAARLRTGGGNVAVKRIPGRLDILTGGGNVALQESGEARIQTGGGNIDVTSARGSLHLNTGGGNVSVKACDGALEAQTGGGNVDLGEIRGPLVARTGAGNIQAGLGSRDGTPKAELRTGSGNIELTLRGRANADVQAETGQGRVSMEPAEGGRLSSDRTRLDARLGAGGGRIQLNTGNGSIRVRVAER